MLNFKSKRTKNKKGVSIIEFALILPILMIILMGTIDISVLLYNKAVITNASREGARYGIVLRTPTYASSTQIIAYTVNYTSNKLITFGTPTQPIVTAVPSVNPPKFGDTLTVTVSYVYNDIMLHYFINHSPQYTLTANSTMTYE